MSTDAAVERLKPLLKRVDARLPWHLLHRGDAVACPCCEGRFSSFRAMHGRPSAKCPRCGSLERHRTLWLYLRERTGLLDERLEVLHMAPERAIERALRQRGRWSYTAADLEPERAGIVVADITALPFATESFDLVICNHVLEHVPDDAAAMAELRRVLRPGRQALLQHPIDEQRAQTYEDPAIVSPVARARAFGQRDHVRIYGRDFRDRLVRAGFEVAVERYVETVGAREAARYGLIEDGARFSGSDIHVATKPA